MHAIQDYNLRKRSTTFFSLNNFEKRKRRSLVLLDLMSLGGVEVVPAQLAVLEHLEGAEG